MAFMTLLENLKHCATCAKVPKHGPCELNNECVCSNEYKKHWKICQPCKTCKYKDNKSVDFIYTCEPCYKNDFCKWKLNLDWEHELRNIPKPRFEVPY